MLKDKFIINKYLSIVCLALMLTAQQACKKSENYFDKLYAQPEIMQNYDPVYGIGDTVTIEGRLVPENGLSIQIGGVEASVVSQTRADGQPVSGFQKRIDRVKVLITEEMGIGTNRTVAITSGGSTIAGPSIEIIESSKMGQLPNELQLVKQYDLPGNPTMLFCQNGKGSVYFWNGLDKSVKKISKDGTVGSVFDASALADNFGSFQVIKVNSGGVNPQENALYLSVLSTDNSAENTKYEIYRLIKIDLTRSTAVTLNRTLYPKQRSNSTLASVQPFEGNVSAVKIYSVTGIYPDSKGDVYLLLGQHILARLRSDGGLKYLFNFSNFNYQFIPAIHDPTAGRYYDIQSIHNLLPGIKADFLLTGIDPEEKLLYGASGVETNKSIQLDLANQVVVGSFSGKLIYPVSWESRQGDKPQISGSFNILTGGQGDQDNSPGLFGRMPIPGRKILILYYQSIDDAPKNRYYSQFPALGTLSFEEKRGARYAPGKLIRNGFVLRNQDRMLNYDENGMVYMTANSNTVIVKTKAR